MVMEQTLLAQEEKFLRSLQAASNHNRGRLRLEAVGNGILPYPEAQDLNDVPHVDDPVSKFPYRTSSVEALSMYS
jgi:hypothetical protein